MNEQMDCLRYRAHLDEWIDGLLDDQTAAQMQAHADACPDCAEEARLARETLALLHTLEDEIPVPLPAQAAWRSAVRSEAAQARRKRRFPAAVRAVGSAAAALVVLAGCTGVFRMTGLLHSTPAQPAAVLTAAETDESPAYFNARRTSPDKQPRTQPMTYIASDGAADETEEAAAGARALPGDAVLAVETAAPMLVRSVERTILTENYDGASQNIRDLTEQYCGYLADDAVKYADSGLRTGEFTAVIPAMEADSFLQMIDHIGNVAYSAEHLEDVSASVRDIQARLNALETEQSRLNELIAAAADAEELSRLSMQMEITLNKLDEVQSESVTLQQRMDNVRISIRLEELYAAASASPTTAPAIGARMGDAFHRSAEGLRAFARDMAVSLMIIAPFLLIALLIAAIVLAVVLVSRRNRRR